MENKIKRVRCVKFTEKLVSEQNEESVPLRYNDVSVHVDPVIENQERDDAIVEGDRNNKESNRRYPSRDRSIPKKLDDYVVYSVDSQASVCVDYCYRVGYVPQTLQDAVRCEESSDWHQTMDSEMESLVQNDTFNVDCRRIT